MEMEERDARSLDQLMEARVDGRGRLPASRILFPHDVAFETANG